MPTDEAEGPSGRHRTTAGTTASEELAYLVGGLLIELGSKIQEAGVDGVRILTEEEAQQTQLRWFREGWSEHARATEQARATEHGYADPHADTGPDVRPSSASSARLFQFPTGPRDTSKRPCQGPEPDDQD